ncbi:MAG: DUF4923 family protein [Alistipes sp.]|nr:DUF4923 family protein [Alistipes sp.]
MKKLILLLALTLSVGSATAQNWSDLLTKIGSAITDKVTDGELTRLAIVGEWEYTAPGVRFEGEDLATTLSGAALESTVASKLETAYKLVGIRPGACAFTFAKDNTFTAVVGSHKLSGTYEFEPDTHVMTLHFAKGQYDLGTLSGHAFVSGTELQLVFPVTGLVRFVTALGSKISSLASVAELLAKYENVYLGFQFAK